MFREIDSNSDLFVKKLISRNYCQEVVRRVNIYAFSYCIKEKNFFNGIVGNLCSLCF